MRKISFLLTLFALMIFASDAYAQRGGGGRGGGGPRGGGGQQGGGPRGGGAQQGGQQGGGQCQRGGGQMRQGGGTQSGVDGAVDEVEVITQTLARLDQNRDGVIARNEVPSQLQTRMTVADVNRDGVLNRMEQLAVIDRARILNGRTNVNGLGLNEDIFEQLDRNQDNSITRTEVPRQLQRLFQSLDSNNDGALDAEEQTATLERLKSKINPEKPKKREPTL